MRRFAHFVVRCLSWFWDSLTNQDGRRAWAFLALLGASGVFTLFAAVVLWIVRRNDYYAFWLGETGLGLVAICLTGFMAMFVKREISITREGITVKDDGNATSISTETVGQSPVRRDISISSVGGPSGNANPVLDAGPREPHD